MRRGRTRPAGCRCAPGSRRRSRPAPGGPRRRARRRARRRRRSRSAAAGNSRPAAARRAAGWWRGSRAGGSRASGRRARTTRSPAAGSTRDRAVRREIRPREARHTLDGSAKQRCCSRTSASSSRYEKPNPIARVQRQRRDDDHREQQAGRRAEAVFRASGAASVPSFRAAAALAFALFAGELLLPTAAACARGRRAEPLPYIEIVTGGAARRRRAAADHRAARARRHGRGVRAAVPRPRRARARRRPAAASPVGGGQAWFIGGWAHADKRAAIAAELLALADRVVATAEAIRAVAPDARASRS